MRRRTLLLGLPMLGLPGLVTACMSPNPTLYTLAAVPGVKLDGPLPGTVEVRRIGLAGYLDRPGIVRRNAAYELTLANDDRWGSPLSEMLGRVLIEDLAGRLPGCTVYSDTGAITTDPERVVEVDILRLDTGNDGMVVLAAEAAVRADVSHAALATASVRLQALPNSPSTRDFVATLSALLGQLADRVAGMLQASESRSTSDVPAAVPRQGLPKLRRPKV